MVSVLRARAKTETFFFHTSVCSVRAIPSEETLRGAGMNRAKTLVSAAEHSVESKEAPEAARIELRNLLNDMDVYTSKLEDFGSFI